MPKRSAGLLVHRRAADGGVQVLVVHPGGPFWAHQEAGAWSIPKGEVSEGEEPLAVAEREFGEELGQAAPLGSRVPLGEVTQAGGKRVRAWAVAGDLDVDCVRSNTFELEWPPRSGRRQTFPEVDRAAWVSLAEAGELLVPAQRAFLDRLPRPDEPSS